MADYATVKESDPSLKVSTKFTWLEVTTWKNVLFIISCVLTGGLLAVLCINYPTIRMRLISTHVDGGRADFIMVEEADQDPQYVEVEHYKITEGEFACFEFCGNRYVANRTENWNITKLPAEPERFTERFITNTDENRPSRQYLMSLYGLNRMKIEAADTFTIALQEVVSPFYLFQYFAVAIWLYTDYVIYSVVVLFITFMSIVFCVKGKLFNLQRLHDLAGTQHPVTTYDRLTRTRAAASVSDQTLVPGDAFVITPGMAIPADCILIQGRVVVDESMLTGESVPVTKTEYKHSTADPDATKRTANILYSGTVVKVVYQGSDAIAVTYKSGFRSARGELIAALITPKQEVVSFMPDAMLAILFMVVITTVIFGWSADQLKKIDTTDGDIVIAYLTALTIAVPPGLVACLSIGTSISVARLQYKKISITDTGKLNAAGYVSYACFDKTGTLTDENIVFQGTKLYENGSAADSNLKLTQIANEIMSTCHSLSIVEGKPAGDPLEVELFAHPGWALSVNQSTSQMIATPPANQVNGGKEHVILRQFEFSPEKLRAATLLNRPNGNGTENILLLKGSPEMISKLSNALTVPKSFETELTSLAKQGFRVLALAYRICTESKEQLMSASQTDLEKDLIFLGLVYFSNKLKPDTFPATIQALHDAKIHVNMITGDHFHTAAAISTDCNILKKDGQMYLIDAPQGVELTVDTQPIIIDPRSERQVQWDCKELIEKYYGAKNESFDVIVPTDVEANKVIPEKNGNFQVVITGAGFQCIRNTQSELMEPLCRITSVFARMKPADKKHVVEELMKPNSRVNPFKQCHVVFCGDGANDMEALSTATVGVSLCDTATTVAAAIVSTLQTPLAVVDVLKEGRCSLVTAYTLVNFNIMYAIIQLFMTCFLNNVGLVFGDYMYLVQDMFFSLFLGLCIANTPPSDSLAVKLPPQTLFHPGLMAKLLIQLGIFPAFQAITIAVLYSRDWYTRPHFDDPLNESYDNLGAALNIVALAQLMIASVVVTIGQPYRQAWYTNKSHLIVLALHTAYILYLLFGKNNEFMIGMDNVPAPNNFQGMLIGIIAANVFVSAIFTKLADFFF